MCVAAAGDTWGILASRESRDAAKPGHAQQWPGHCDSDYNGLVSCNIVCLRTARLLTGQFRGLRVGYMESKTWPGWIQLLLQGLVERGHLEVRRGGALSASSALTRAGVLGLQGRGFIELEV